MGEGMRGRRQKLRVENQELGVKKAMKPVKFGFEVWKLEFGILLRILFETLLY
ncbi:MAG: hypothetical protein IGS54_06450 [Elainella sp. C42_A2020_010]|nr:hypothetical protein [Elainella sp. C42_A2020_010]